MSLRETGAAITYSCLRRWPGPGGVRSHVVVTPGDAIEAADLTSCDHFLTARWVLFSAAGHRHRFARAWHEPWPLYRATALVDDGLVEAAGLPAPNGEPLVHYSPGVDVRIGPPERYGR